MKIKKCKFVLHVEDGRSENKMISTDTILEDKVDKYTDCNLCHVSLAHCHCKCHYCGKRDDCECVLFDAVTGG
jgi:hypothetical protein